MSDEPMSNGYKLILAYAAGFFSCLLLLGVVIAVGGGFGRLSVAREREQAEMMRREAEAEAAREAARAAEARLRAEAARREVQRPADHVPAAVMEKLE